MKKKSFHQKLITQFCAALLLASSMVPFTISAANEPPPPKKIRMNNPAVVSHSSQTGDVETLIGNHDHGLQTIRKKNSDKFHKHRRCHKRGPTGPTGPAGENGVNGATGPAGPTGAGGSLTSSYISSSAQGSLNIPDGVDYTAITFNADTTTNSTITHGGSPYSAFTVTTPGIYQIAWAIGYSDIGSSSSSVDLKLVVNSSGVSPNPIQQVVVQQDGSMVFSGSYLISLTANQAVNLAMRSLASFGAVGTRTISIFLIAPDPS